jgi:hypothetical protein
MITIRTEEHDHKGLIFLDVDIRVKQTVGNQVDVECGDGCKSFYIIIRRIDLRIGWN